MSENTRRKPRGRKTVVQHPLFPATVALWFGALFGLGSIAVRPALIERAVLVAHLDSIIPAAAPPLGMTARILLALAMAATGALIGAIIALRMARPAAAAAARRQAVADEAREAMADAAPEEPARNVVETRMRPLSVPDDIEAPTMEVADILPDASENPLPPAPASRHPTLAPINVIAAPIADETTAEGPAANGTATDSTAPAAPLDITALAAPDQPAASGSAWETAGSPVAPLDLDMLGLEPLDSSPDDDVATASAIPDEPAMPDEPAQAPAAAAPPPADIPLFAMPVGNAAERILSADLENLSNVELVERLAIALQRRRERDEAAAALLSAPAMADVAGVDAGGAMLTRLAEPERPAPPSFRPVTLAPAASFHASAEPVEPPAAGLAMPSLAAAPPPAAVDTPAFLMPAALRPVTLDPIDGADHDLPAFVPPRRLSASGGFTAGAVADAESHTFAVPEAAGLDACQDYLAEDDDAGSDPDDAMVEDDAGADDHEQETPRTGMFGSLLRVGRSTPRPDLIRLDDAEPAFLAAGDAAHSDAADAAPFASGPVIAFRAPTGGATGTADPARPVAELRRFDPPTSGDAESRPAGSADAARDPEETERALRAALATLQRMSGAA